MFVPPTTERMSACSISFFSNAVAALSASRSLAGDSYIHLTMEAIKHAFLIDLIVGRGIC